MVEHSTVSHTPDRFQVKPGAEEFPLMVVASVTYVCNARCPACPYTQSAIRQSYRDTPFMKPAVFELIARECGKHGAYVRFSGGGEPLLHPQFLDLIWYATGVGARVGVITNGSRLVPLMVDELLTAGVDAVEISVDAADKETYSRVRVGLDFDRLVSNVRYLMRRRDEMGVGANTRVIASVINQRAIEGKLDETVAFWKGIVDEVQVRKYLTWGIGDASESGDPTPYLAERVPCPFPFERLNVDSRGKIEFCGFDIAGETDFGNVRGRSIESVWQGEEFGRWRRLLLEGRYEEVPVCAKCPDWRYRSWNYNYWNVLRTVDEKRAT